MSYLPHSRLAISGRRKLALLGMALLLAGFAAVQTISAGRADFAALGQTTVSDAGASVTIDAAALPGIPAASVEAVELTATRLDATESPRQPAAEARYEVLPEAVYRLDLSAHLRDDLQPAALGSLAHEASICLARPQTAWNPVLVQHDGRRWQALTPTVSTAERGADVEVCALSREIGVVAVANADRLRTHLEVGESGKFGRWTAEYTVRASELLAELPGVSALTLWNGSRWLLYSELAAEAAFVLDFTIIPGDLIWMDSELQDTTLPAPANLRASNVASGMLFLRWIADPHAGDYQLSWTSEEGDEGSLEIEAGSDAAVIVSGLVNDREYTFNMIAESATAGFATSDTATIVATPLAVLAALNASHIAGGDVGCSLFYDDWEDRYFFEEGDQCLLKPEVVRARILQYCDADCYNELAATVPRGGQVGGGSASGGAVGDSSAYGSGGQVSTDPIDPNTKAAFQAAFRNASNPQPHSSDGLSKQDTPVTTPNAGINADRWAIGLRPCWWLDPDADPSSYCGPTPQD